MAKGGGTENMSSLTMLKPSQGWAGMSQAVRGDGEPRRRQPLPADHRRRGHRRHHRHGRRCSPRRRCCATSAARTRTRASPAMEAELLERINALGIGPQGLGGTMTALAVFIEEMPCHIASLPVAVNVQCHAQRHKTARPCEGGGPMASRRSRPPSTDEVVRDLRAGDAWPSPASSTGARRRAQAARRAARGRRAAALRARGPIIYYMGPARPAGRRDRLGRPDDQRPHGRLRAAADARTASRG